MDKLTTNKWLTRRGGLAAFAMTMLLSLAAMPAHAQVDGGLQLEMSKSLRTALYGDTSPAHARSGIGAGKVAMQDIHFAASVGVARGQMLRISVAIPNNQDRSRAPGGKLYVGTELGVFRSQVKVFDALTGAEVASFELRNPSAGLHTFDINGNGSDILRGSTGDDAGATRVPLRIEVRLAVCYDPRTNEPGVYSPTFELVDFESGRTTVQGGLVKLGSKRLVLQGDGSY